MSALPSIISSVNTIMQYNQHLWSLYYTVVDIGGNAKVEGGHSCLGMTKHKEKGGNLSERNTDKGSWEDSMDMGSDGKEQGKLNGGGD